jgi:hypothetical protein
MAILYDKNIQKQMFLVHTPSILHGVLVTIDSF